MPPGPAYNWLCVLHTSADIFGNIIRNKSAQITPGFVEVLRDRAQKRRRIEGPLTSPSNITTSDSGYTALNGTLDGADVVTAVEARSQNAKTEMMSIGTGGVRYGETAGNRLNAGVAMEPQDEPIVVQKSVAIPLEQETEIQGKVPLSIVEVKVEDVSVPPALQESTARMLEVKEKLAPIATAPESVTIEPEINIVSQQDVAVAYTPPVRILKSSKVPSSRIGRLFHYGGLAASLGYGAASELIRRTTSSEETTGSLILTESNIRRLVSKLSQMRGAALKLGQFMSIQDTHLLPPDIDAIFRRVQDSAHYMPSSQLNQVFRNALGDNWEEKYFDNFEHVPFAAASIGQVHRATLKAKYSPTSKPIPVAVKVQFPNIRHSIESDLSYVRMLLTASKILPKGLFLDKTIQVMKDELKDECSYTREAEYLRLFGKKEWLGGDGRFKVPWVWEGSTDEVLVMEMVGGVSVGEANRAQLSQEDRNDIASRIIELCLRELFVFRTMQTDPNWTNFLWNQQTRQIELVDFGATRSYSKEFMDDWFQLLQAASSDDYEACKNWSLKLGYLTGEENKEMLDAHITSLTLLATPFKAATSQPFGFGPTSQWTEITKDIRSFIPVMLQHRLTPPPRETYSLNRKLSGAFLLAARLDAKVDTRMIWEKVAGGYQVGEEN